MLTMARANILAALAVNFFYFAVNLLKKKRLALFFFITSASTIFSLIVVFLFLSDKTEASLSVKRLHKLSYSKVFDSNVLKYFFPGWGAGSEFYSLGYKEWTYITELSLYETIRRYGMIQTILIFFSVWLSPLIRFCLSSRSLYNKIFWSGTFFAYLFVACTNPFLLGSIGFCALLFMTTILEFKI